MGISSYTSRVEGVRPYELRNPVLQSSYRLGDLLQCLLVSFGLYGQQLLVLAATGLNLNSRLLTVPARAFIVALSLSVVIALFLRPNRAFLSWPLAAFAAFWGSYGARIAVEASTRIDVVTETGRFTSGFISMMAIGGCFLPGVAVLINSCWAWNNKTRIITFSLALTSALVMLKFYGAHIANFESRMAAGSTVGDVRAVHPLALGYLGGALLLVALHSFICGGISKFWRGSIGVVFAGIGAYLLVGSASRGPILSVALPSMLLIASQVRKFDFRRLLVIVIVFGASCVGLVVIANQTGSYVFDRLTSTPDAIAAGSSSASRIDMYKKVLVQISEAPFVGRSLTLRDDDGTDTYPHNLILESLLATGLIGTIPLMYLIVAGLIATWRILTRYPELGWIPILFLLFLTGSMFSGAIYSNSQMWISLMATLSCYAWCRKNDLRETVT